jgi:hypothetical protein
MIVCASSRATSVVVEGTDVVVDGTSVVVDGTDVVVVEGGFVAGVEVVDDSAGDEDEQDATANETASATKPPLADLNALFVGLLLKRMIAVAKR